MLLLFLIDKKIVEMDGNDIVLLVDKISSCLSTSLEVVNVNINRIFALTRS